MPPRKNKKRKMGSSCVSNVPDNEVSTPETEKKANRRQRKKRKIDKDVRSENTPLTRESKNAPVTRQRRHRKPNIRDISITLGIEKPQQRLSKAQVGQYDDDELQEHRVKEEIEKLSNFQEVLEASMMKNVDSDDESANGDIDVCVDLSDDEDFNCTRNGEIQCPRPLPRRVRGGVKCVRRNPRAVEVSHEEVKEMCMIIKSSMRKSLTATNNDVTLKDEELGFLEADNEECVLKSAPAENTEEKGTSDNFIVYRSFRQKLELQHQWLNRKAADHATSSKKYTQELCTYYAGRNGLPKQIYIEHLSWITVAVHSNETVNIVKNGVLAWLPGFTKKCTQRYPQLGQDGTPGSGTELDMLLRIATVKVTQKLQKVLQALVLTRQALSALVEHVANVYNDKRTICMEFEVIHEALNMRSARFDESSVWGLKPIRLALEPPYFKTDDGLMAYPMTPDAASRLSNYGFCFFKRDKQKWTTKDLQQLKTCIKETLFSKRVNALTDRYEVLMADCLQRYEGDMIREGRFDAPMEPFKRRRGRPKKSELEFSSKYGIIKPVVAVLSNGISIRSEISPRLLAEWRNNEEKSLKSRSYEELVYMENELVDWATVANKMVVKSRKHRTAEDCELAWRHEVHPKVNDKRWSAEESRRLKEIYARLGNEWASVANELNTSTNLASKPGRTAYQCYFRVRNRLDPPKKLVWTEELDFQVLDKLDEYPGNWRLVAASINDPAATKRQVIERYKKTINPVLRNGAFTRVEDCLLILTIEKLKPFLAREGHFGCLLAYLPWRCETTWRDRANNLFSDWIVPWTLEEDKMLLTLAKTMNRNWQKISEEFTSFKNRKGCLTRYKILMRRLKDERFNNSLEAYHEAYAMTRYNVFQYKHLKEILELLQKVKQHPLSKEHQHFVGLLRDREPSEVRLQHMLLTFDKEILDSAILSLDRYVKTRDNYWKNWINNHGKRKRTFDRRTFHPENPQSVASALHIRGLELKRKEDILNLNDFEEEIYKFYARFCRTKALKPTADRPYIPDIKTLAQWSAVSRLIETSVDELEDRPLKKKWQALKSNVQLSRSGEQRRRGWFKKELRNLERKRANQTNFPTLTTSPQEIPGQEPSVEPTHSDAGDNDEDEEYILIPPEPAIKRSGTKRRGKRNMEDDDPEFVVAPKTRNGRKIGLRRSKIH